MRGAGRETLHRQGWKEIDMRMIALLAGVLCALNPAFGQNCDRECLRGVITSYLNALVAHDPKALPLTTNVRFTEDTVEMPPGEGLWKTASGLGTFRQDIIDVRTGVAGTHVVMLEKGAPVLFQVRLKMASGRISEIDPTVVRNQTEGMIYMSLIVRRGPLRSFDLAPPEC